MPSLFSKMQRVVLTGLCSTTLLISPIAGASACTSFVVTAKDDGRVYGRTMEFGFETESTVSLIPRNYELTSSGELNGDKQWEGAKWKSKYAVIGMNAMKHETAIVDGVNEAGLAAGALYFPGFAEYSDVKASGADDEVAPIDFLVWVLSQFETVEEVKEAVKSIKLVDVDFAPLGEVPPLHFTIHDRSGKSIVIEPVDDGLKVYDNELGVMTNSPQFDWHLTNLRNYVNLTPINSAGKKFPEGELQPLGQGSGMLGVPGDVTPPSRFVRVTAFVTTAEEHETAKENLNVAGHILNNFDIPKGFAQPEALDAAQSASSQQDDNPDYTQWSVMADLNGAVYYVRKLNAMNFNSVSFKDFDPDGSTLTILKPLVADPFSNLADAAK
ncbi:choloylglycine hydrolase family protein [Pseudovibrio sp. POLY-S9]|uniref:choloylglycine hydrolase family protein n=1 Tax=Pseudovibrio sp. POLY-S9 TaxID=1576596 RepID=UPI0009EA06E5|nr:choloylglycine hydrolase family protein [Pseudovibrio sp. POLY-S9]